MNQQAPTTEDALKYIVEYLRNPPQSSYAKYGYGVYLPNIVRAFAPQLSEGSPQQAALSRPFLDAAWELCRRGIIRPGVTEFHKQATQDGSAGSGFSVTPFGRQWIDEDADTYVPTEPERAGALLAQYAQRFGEGFQQRSQEAVRCYGAHAYLACCAMCGAAAEWN